MSALDTWKSSLGATFSRFPIHRLPAWFKTRLLAHSGLMQPAWYSRSTGRTAKTPIEAARLIVSHGDGPENAANSLFDADWYRETYGFSGGRVDALLHYILFGERQGFKPNPWFDPWYVRNFNASGQQYLRPRRLQRTVLAAYCNHWQSGLNPHPYFDSNWYCWQYPDVASGELNPLAHFLAHGMQEGREPNAYFSSRWYLSTFDDVRGLGAQAAQHFILFGAAELRSPGPNFDMRGYAAQYPDYLQSGLDPLGHFLAIGRAEGRTGGTRYLELWELLDDRSLPSESPKISRQTVEVVIPVYRGLEETRRCIDSVAASCQKHRNRLRVRIYNDASPDPEITAYLRRMSAEHSFILCENVSNLGFVSTVNAGMRAGMESKDTEAVILLNSDTEVAGNWADRLLDHALGDRVGTVTATSNNATICSFPSIGCHSLPSGFTVSEIDELALRANPGVSVDIPTAVGFCMLITRTCLQSVGYFDEEAFGRGYGEENDFCMRATAQGFRHLHALDVFVYHQGEVSFADSSASGKVNAGRIIRDRYPDYEADVARFCSLDPAKGARLRLLGALWRAGRQPIVAIVTHDLGGGTEKHVQSISAALAGQSHVLIIRPSVGHESLLRLQHTNAEGPFDLIVDALDGPGFARLLVFFGVTSVQVHHLYGHGGLIRDGIALHGVRHTLDVHDYFLICPQITLTTPGQEYCGEPDAAGCDACIAQRPSLGATDIRNWREAHAWAVLEASQVRAPSHDTAARLEKYFPIRPSVHYHEKDVVQAPPPPERDKPPGDPFRVVLMGILSKTKGRRKVFEAIEASEALGLPLHFHLVGESEGVFPAVGDGRFSWTGVYTDDELPRLIREARPDVFLFASSAPETYSYTLTAAMGTGIPILATDLGAFSERLEGYWCKQLYPHHTTGAQLAGIINDFVGQPRPHRQEATNGRDNEALPG